MNPKSLKGRSLLTWINFTPEEIRYFLELAKKVKAESLKSAIHRRFRGKSLALILEKRFTSARIAFETAFGEEGGHPVFLSSDDILLEAGEDSRPGTGASIEDAARVLGRMFDAIAFGGLRQADAETLAKFSGLPVYNGLTDSFNPTQALADFFTLEQEFGDLKGRKLAFVGDGRNTIARSLMVICSKMGADLSIVAPKTLWPDPELKDICRTFASESDASLEITDNKEEGVRGACAIYADSWFSSCVGAPNPGYGDLLLPYQVDSRLLASTGDPRSVFLHGLPAAKGKEVSFELIESPSSRVFEQAENRKHAIKAILLATL
ncbi:MAG TPA: ornithine carbamoyltransferase [Rectinemataceae bacterium]|nr:ornithine carbamoyltransferase [Rectinemataceae bacterium]